MSKYTTEFQERLKEAAYNGDIEQLEIYLNELDAFSAEAASLKDAALFSAAAGGHIDVMQLLIDNGADIDEGLRVSAEGGHMAAMEFLIGRGAKVSDVALEVAAKGGHIDAMKLLIANGGKNFNWALEGAAQGGHIDAMKFSIEKGAENLDIALKIVAMYGHMAAMELLIANGAKASDVALEGAADGNYIDAMKLLIANGAKVSATALSYATKGGHVDAMKLLIANGDKNRLNLDLALVSAAKVGNVDAMELLIKNGAKKALSLPLSYAAGGGHIDAMELLIKNGATINYALGSAIAKGQLDAMKLLIANGADISSATLQQANADPTSEQSKLILAAYLADQILSKPEVLDLPDDLSNDQLEVISKRIGSKIHTRKELNELQEYIDSIEGYEVLKAAVGLHASRRIDANERSFEFASAEMLQILEPEKFQIAIPYSELAEFAELAPKSNKDGTTDIEVTYKSYQDEIFSKDDKGVASDHILLAKHLNSRFESREARAAFVNKLEASPFRDQEHYLKNIDTIIDNPIIGEEHKVGLRELKTELLPIVIKSREAARAKDEASAKERSEAGAMAGAGAGEDFVPSAGARAGAGTGEEFVPSAGAGTGEENPRAAGDTASAVTGIPSAGTNVAEPSTPRPPSRSFTIAEKVKAAAAKGKASKSSRRLSHVEKLEAQRKGRRLDGKDKGRD